MRVNIPNKSFFGSMQFLTVCGFFWEPEEFVREALNISHPMAAETIVPSILLDEATFHVTEETFVWPRSD